MYGATNTRTLRRAAGLGDEVVMAEGYLQDSRRCESKFQRSNKLDILLPSTELVTWLGADWFGGWTCAMMPSLMEL